MTDPICPLCKNPLLDGDAVMSRQGLIFHAGCGEGSLAWPVILESLHQRTAALEKHLEQIHAWHDAHAKGHDAGDAAMCGRVEALEVGLAQLGVTVFPVTVDGEPLVMPNPAPVDAGPPVPAGEGPVTSPFRDDRGPTTPPADDAAVEALTKAMISYPDGPTWKGAAQRALAAIRCGEVPRIVDLHGQATLLGKREDEIAALRVDVEKYRGETERHIRLLSECANERDQLKARVAELEQARHVLAGNVERLQGTGQKLAAAEAERDQLKAKVAELEAKQINGDMERAIAKDAEAERDRLAAKLAEAKDKISGLRDRLAYLEGATNNECGTPLFLAIKERDEARAELAAIKGRKVTMPKLTYPANTDQQIRNVAIQDCKLAIRAAGVEVTE